MYVIVVFLTDMDEDWPTEGGDKTELGSIPVSALRVQLFHSFLLLQYHQ